MILPWVEMWRCPPPPSPLSLESLSIARQSPRDSGTSLRSQELLQNLGFAAGIALRCGTGLGSLARRSGTRQRGGIPATAAMEVLGDLAMNDAFPLDAPDTLPFAATTPCGRPS